AHSVTLEGINFELSRGEVLGVGGLMGAGRTELLMHIFAARGRRVSGEVNFKGKPLQGNSAGESIANGLIMVTEDRKRLGLVLEESISFNMSLSHIKSFVKNGLLDQRLEVVENKKYFQKLGIKAPALNSKVAGLSGGNQQKVVLGKALMTSPDLVFLDEPTRGIDVGAKKEIYEFAKQNNIDPMKLIFHSGEEYEIIFTTPKKYGKKIIESAKRTKTPVIQIGKVSRGNSVFVKKNDSFNKLKDLGWKHFK
ncbi:MAG: ATP-binding cassette domain-containing protein, partial [Nitrosopumilaceae archaeon]|nr:ATP-binding cassette domain-containing protein [Nitrosopumilaceae archaeon]